MKKFKNSINLKELVCLIFMLMVQPFIVLIIKAGLIFKVAPIFEED